jgi:hypothetical protein
MRLQRNATPHDAKRNAAMVRPVVANCQAQKFGESKLGRFAGRLRSQQRQNGRQTRQNARTSEIDLAAVGQAARLASGCSGR